MNFIWKLPLNKKDEDNMATIAKVNKLNARISIQANAS